MIFPGLWLVEMDVFQAISKKKKEEGYVFSRLEEREACLILSLVREMERQQKAVKFEPSITISLGARHHGPGCTMAVRVLQVSC